MIRTDIVTLSVIKGVAYRQKLSSGGYGIVILRKDASQPGIASVSRMTGEPVPAANTPKKLYPKEAFEEAVELTAGMPYRRQGAVQLKGISFKKAPITEEVLPEEVIVDSEEYGKIVEKYTDKDGKLSYALLNKDLIRFAHSSSIVRKMIEEGAKEKDIRLYAVGSKFRGITKNDKMTDEQVEKMLELLDEVSPKGVLKEFNEELRRKLKTNK